MRRYTGVSVFTQKSDPDLVAKVSRHQVCYTEKEHEKSSVSYLSLRVFKNRNSNSKNKKEKCPRGCTGCLQYIASLTFSSISEDRHYFVPCSRNGNRGSEKWKSLACDHAANKVWSWDSNLGLPELFSISLKWI